MTTQTRTEPSIQINFRTTDLDLLNELSARAATLEISRNSLMNMLLANAINDGKCYHQNGQG